MCLVRTSADEASREYLSLSLFLLSSSFSFLFEKKEREKKDRADGGNRKFDQRRFERVRLSSPMNPYLYGNNERIERTSNTRKLDVYIRVVGPR